MLGRNNNTKKRPPPPFLPPSIIVGDDSIAGRTRRQKRAIASKWDLQTPIIIEIISWLDQESLMNLSLVSKQLHSTITNEPGNKNKLYPVFEVTLRGSSTRRLFQILRNNFLNEEKKNKLQYYPRMRLNNVQEYVFDRISDYEIQQMTRDVRMDWITSLDISSSNSPSPTMATTGLPVYSPAKNYYNSPQYVLSKILPQLRELNFTKSGVVIDSEISKNCPLLEKLTADNLICFTLNGNNLRFCNNLKEIYVDHSSLNCIGSRQKDQISDLNNHHDIFMFHRCSKALERVSIRNMKFKGFLSEDDNYDDEDFKQNVLIKFVRNAPPTLYWFRSDLTPDNIVMLRMERPGIELLN